MLSYSSTLLQEPMVAKILLAAVGQQLGLVTVNTASGFIFPEETYYTKLEREGLALSSIGLGAKAGPELVKAYRNPGP